MVKPTKCNPLKWGAWGALAGFIIYAVQFLTDPGTPNLPPDVIIYARIGEVFGTMFGAGLIATIAGVVRNLFIRG
jgi:hypothetical protein